MVQSSRRTLLTGVLLLICVNNLYAIQQIICPLNSLSFLLPYVASFTENDLFVSDVDEVLIKLQEHLGRSILFDDTAPHLFQQLHHHGIITIGLTAIHTGNHPDLKKNTLQQWRIKDLRRKQIWFSQIPNQTEWPYEQEATLSPNELYPECQSSTDCKVEAGIIFSALYTKGSALKAFLSTFMPGDKQPNRIIFVDDRLNNLFSVARMCQELGITFIGLHYQRCLQANEIIEILNIVPKWEQENISLRGFDTLFHLGIRNNFYDTIFLPHKPTQPAPNASPTILDLLEEEMRNLSSGTDLEEQLLPTQQPKQSSSKKKHRWCCLFPWCK